MEPKSKEKNNQPTQPHWREMNRKQRRETMRKIQSEDLSLELVHRDAAGIEVAHLRAAAKFVSAIAGDSDDADVLAATK